MSATHFVDVIVTLKIRGRWLVRGDGLMDAFSVHPDISEDCCVRIFNALTPEQVEAWLRVGTMMLASNLDDTVIPT